MVILLFLVEYLVTLNTLDYIFIILSNIAHIGHNKYVFHHLNARMFGGDMYTGYASEQSHCRDKEKDLSVGSPLTEQREGALYMQHGAAASTDTQPSSQSSYILPQFLF